MTNTKAAPYGAWKSPISPDLIVSKTVGLDDIAIDGEDIYWLESRPSEAGRCVIVRWSSEGRLDTITPPDFYVRNLVHEMGGGAYTVADGTVYFCNYRDQRLYRQVHGGDPMPISPKGPTRYADGVIDTRHGRIIMVREDHPPDAREPVNVLATQALTGGSHPQAVLVSGNDFYASPRLSPDGSRLAWLTWNHPNMPWDGTELWVAEVAAGGEVVHAEHVAGGDRESIVQPEWSPDGVLYYVSDRSGWWNLRRERGGVSESVTSMEAEFARPPWVFGISSFAFESTQRLVCSYFHRGRWNLATVDTSSGALDVVETPYTEIDSVCAATGFAAFLGSSPSEFATVVRHDFDSGLSLPLRRASELSVDPDYLSFPEAVEFPTEGGCTAHGYYYPPCNPEYESRSGERPPLRVLSHGGPTAATSSSLNLAIQYWTSRGIAILDVNYGGSSGYGREYRRRLEGRWGIVDVDDCVNGALYLVQRGDVDGDRLAIKGGSAGGFTTLSALTFRDVFKAGASYYGISDLEALARDTHKFESRYLDRLIGPYPECRDRYRARSPIHFVERLSCPLIVFQGLEDAIVPPSQAELMVQAARKKGLPVAYVPFEGEQHGFRRADNIMRALTAELYFLSRVFGFELAEAVVPVPIDNLRNPAVAGRS